MKKISIIILASFLSLASFAQEENIQVEKKSLMNVKVNMLALFDATSAYQASFEYGIGGNLSLQHEFGYITNYTPFYYGSGKELNGLRFRNELRYYFLKKDNIRNSTYTAAEILWMNASLTEEAEFAMDNWTYFETKEYTRKKNVFAFHQKFGYQVQIPNSNAVLDVYVGAGMRSINRITEYPAEGDLSSSNNGMDFFDGISGSDNSFRIIPSFVIGYKIGIFLGR